MTSKKRALDEATPAPPSKLARMAETEPMPSHAVLCNASALALYAELDEMEWHFPIVKSVALSTSSEHEQQLAITHTDHMLTKPNLLALMKACPGLSLPVAFLPPDATTYVDMAPLIAVRPDDAALETYCQNVDLALRKLKAEVEPLRPIADDMVAAAGWNVGVGISSRTWSTRATSLSVLGSIRLKFDPTVASQQDAVTLLRILRAQKLLKGKPTRDY